MKKILSAAACIACFLLYSLDGFANKTDSLLGIVNRSKTDKDALEAWKNLTVYSSRNDPSKTFDFVRTAIKVASRLKDSSSIAMLYKNYGIAHVTLGNRDSATYYYFLSIGILERNDDKMQAAEVYNDVARLFRRDDPERAISFYQKAMDIYTQLKDEAGMAVIWNESGVAYENKGDYEEAEKRYRNSLEIQTRRKDTVGISYALSFISGVKAAKKEFAESEILALEALKLREIIKDSFALAIALTNLGEFYNMTKKYEKAIPYFEKSNLIASRISFVDIRAHNYGQLSMAWQSAGNFKKALEEKNQQVALKDSLFQLNKEKQISEITTRYETAEKEKKIQQQQFELTRKNFTIALVVSVLAIGAGLTYWYFKRKQYLHQQELEIEKRRQQEIATREILKAEESERRRIAAELHDGVGQLMSAARMNLDAVVRELQPLPTDKLVKLERVVSLVDEGCKEVRSVSHSMMPNALLKKGLASALYEFIQKIDQQVIKSQLHIEGLQERLAPETESVLYRVIQECVNNVIKHSGANQLDISVICENEAIDVTIEDNGKGFDVHETSAGIGLQNIKARIQFLKGTLDLDSTMGKGTFVGIHIPL